MDPETDMKNYNTLVITYNQGKSTLSQKQIHGYYERMRNKYYDNNLRTMPIPPKDYSYDKYASILPDYTTE